MDFGQGSPFSGMGRARISASLIFKPVFALDLFIESDPFLVWSLLLS